MLKNIIITAVIAFLIVLVVIYFENVKSFFKNKFSKKNNKKNEPKLVEKKEEKPTYTSEAFKPAVKTVDEPQRDSSIEALFDDDDFLEELSSMFGDEELEMPKQVKQSLNKANEFEFGGRNPFFKESNTESKPKNIAQQIKNLPPEIKALLVDNILKRRDDI